ncbi:MAG TPA: ribbon-helix-helix domain-containing protein [Thermoplasmata archaeon]|jgi:Arc/MetJ-type ribon-helix-helix transcriptional regulator|nr:ribbon-helix-helix domain-containing protein [Thermoplasmata archaeon]
MSDEGEKITIRIPRRFLETIDFLVALDDFSSRSEAVRTAIRDMIYARVEVVSDRIKKMQTAQAAVREDDTLRKEFLQK